MLASMTALPPGADELIRRVYRYAMALQACGIDTAEYRSAMLISMEEGFMLLDCARSGPWQLGVSAPNGPDGRSRDTRFNLALQPRPGVAWARLFGVALIIDADVLPPNDQ